MKQSDEIISSLTNLRSSPKFTSKDWEARGLNPSDEYIINTMVELTNQCIDELLEDVRANTSEKRLKRTLLRGLYRFKLGDFDTEEREFIADEFQKIGQLLGINIADDLNSWFYGKILGLLLKLTKREEKTIQERVIDCKNCKTQLKVCITSIREGCQDSWIIARCQKCSELNLHSIGENAGSLRYENFEEIEMLSKNEYTDGEAIIRLEQIKFFRGNKQ